MISHAPERRVIAGHGTDESAWHATTMLDDLATCDPAAWHARFKRIWIIAPHPDDEILGLGGSIASLADLHAEVHIVAVTDGEASHGHSSSWTPERLAHDRPIELRRALAALGSDASVLRLGLPDGRVGGHRDVLLMALADRLDEDDLLLATCSFDGHPDHEACGEVAQMLGTVTGATVVEYPVWMWHWALPTETTIPWARARRLTMTDDALRRKRAAIDEFVSQITPDGTHEAILPQHVLPRFLRPFEVVFA